MTLRDNPNALEGVALNGRYRVESILGEGGMATVYGGHDQDLNRRVALKILHHHYAADDAFVARFRREAELAAGVSPHPNIVNVYDIRRDGGLEYIVMEYVAGQSLKQLIRNRAPVSVPETIEIGMQVCSGLAYAHKRGVVHRDIKLHNILLDHQGNAKITDFGIALATASSRLTLPGMVMGTVDYMSPEQARGEPATAASDVYSLGLVLFELLAGRLPFEGIEALSARARADGGNLPSPREVNPSVPADVSDVVMQALHRDPADRYPSADAFGWALESLERQTTQRIPAGTATRNAPTRTRGGLAPTFARAALALGILGLAGAGYLGARSLGVLPGAAVTTGHTTGTPGAKPGPTTPATPTRSVTANGGSRPPQPEGKLSVQPVVGATPAIRIAGTRFASGRAISLRVYWRTTAPNPVSGYRWYRTFQALHASGDGSLDATVSLPVSPQAFASSVVTVGAWNSGARLARTTARIAMQHPTAVPTPPPQPTIQPVHGNGKGHGNKHGHARPPGKAHGHGHGHGHDDG